jgi:hypothetical protein
MILSKEAEVILNSANFKHFISLGYSNLKNGEKLIVPIEHLNKGSHSIVTVKCDICGKEKELVYRHYLKCLENSGFYVCSECSGVKISKSLLNKNTDERNTINEKIKKTCFKKYGAANPSQIKDFKDKRRNTMLERHIMC